MKKPRRKIRILRRLTFVGAFALAVIAFLASPLSERTFDRNLISAKRHLHRAMFEFGWTLPRTPDVTRLSERLQAHGLELGAPIFMRIFKKEFELELWMLRDGRFHHFETYPICLWSGDLGPKFKEGDRQAPEGFYTVSKKSLNPNSRWHRSFNLGYPNPFDKSHGRTGSFLMVHGGCGSVGCYAMTDPVISEIWKIVTAALSNGQKRFQVQAFPFRMSERRLAGQGDNLHLPFWRDLKTGFDAFEATWLPPKVSVCNGRYTFSPAATPDGSDPIATRCTS